MDADKPKPVEAGLAAQIAELAHQVIETRNQMIKTVNTLGNVSAEVREIGRLHHEQRRRMFFNSAAAYLIFTVLLGTSFYFTYRSRVERLDFEKETVVREHAATLSKLEAQRQAAEKRREAENRAAAFHRLSQSGQVQKALAQYPEVAQLPLSRVEAAVFQDWVSRSRSRLAYGAYASGMKAFGEKSWKRAVTEFQRSLGYLPNPPHEASLRYYLGLSHIRLGSYQEAATELERAIAVEAEKVVSTDIRFQLGGVYEQLGRRDRARAAYSAFLKVQGSGPLAASARRRLAALK